MTINNLTRLSASNVFKTTRSTSEMKKTLNSINTDKTRIVPETVTSAIGIIDKRMKYAGKLKVLDAFIKGNVNLLFTEERIPSYLSVFPYVDRLDQTNLKIGVIANKCIGEDKTDISNVGTFYALMRAGLS